MSVVVAILTSPLRIAQRLSSQFFPGEAALPDEAPVEAPVHEKLEAALPEAAPVKAPVEHKKSATKIVRPVRSPTRSRPASSPVVKTEATRDLPFRAARYQHKAGFYSEQNLTALAWRGSGSSADPIVLS